MFGRAAPSRLFSLSSPPTVDALTSLCARQATSKEYPLATAIEKNIPIYNLPNFSSTRLEDRAALQDEWYRVLLDGPGVFVTAGMYKDKKLLSNANDVYRSIIEDEKRTLATHGDHFAAGGKNDRIWNSFSKHALTDAKSFTEYYSNPWLALVCSSWLGPGYRITAQINNVKPGGAAQEVHRDYHLGFQTTEAVQKFPRAMHSASQFLTLQGAVAQVDVPLETGPTRLLPYSQKMDEGYMAWRLPEFKEHFVKNYVSLPLRQGDGLFFNPALFHAAGNNESTDINRMVNLLQISSAFGKSMETVEALPIVEQCWDEMTRLYKEKGMTDEVEAIVAAVGDGYPFPTNLDKNSPDQGEMTPPSEQDVLRKCLLEGTAKDQVIAALKELAAKSRA